MPKKATKKQMDEALKEGFINDYGVIGVEFVVTNNGVDKENN